MPSVRKEAEWVGVAVGGKFFSETKQLLHGESGVDMIRIY